MNSRDCRALTWCAMCEKARSTKTGEHVLPSSLLRSRFPPEHGPYEITSPSEIIKAEKFDAIKIACCQACNARLNNRFEDQKIRPVMRLLEEDEPSLDLEQTRLAALWFLKTWSLLSHPRTEYQTSAPFPLIRWLGVPQSVWSWTVQGEDPPSGLSAWAFRHQQEESHGNSTPTAPRLELPRVIADDMDQQFYVQDFTLEKINVSVLWHPGWQIRHPAVATGEVMQMWPLRPGATINRLPDLDQRPIRWATGPVLRFLPGAYDGTLPPLTPGVSPALQVMDRLELGSA